MNAPANIDYATLIREDAPDGFLVNSRLYQDEAVFQDEMDRIFHRGWVYVGHDTEVPLAGDYYADRAAIARRLLRMKSGAMYIQDPRAERARLVSNVEIHPDGDSAACVHSTFNITEFRRRGHQTWLRTWAGRSEHYLRQVDGAWEMAFKKVLLVNSDGELPALGFLV